MLTTTLTVSNDQVSSGTCGPSAVLASMMDNQPAQAIKKSLQVGWTGSFTGSGGEGIEHDDVCEFIFEQAPGIVPYANYNPGWNSTWCKCKSMTFADCTDKASPPAGFIRPCQAAGVEGMWTQLLLASSYRSILDGECVTNLGLMYPGVYGEGYKSIEQAQSTFALQISDMLRSTYGGEASLVTNDTVCEGVFEPGACASFQFGAVGRALVVGAASGTSDALTQDYRDLLRPGVSDEDLLGGMNTGAINGTQLSEPIVDILKELNDALLPNATLSEGLGVQLQYIRNAKLTDISQLDELCAHDVAMLAVLIDPMNEIIQYQTSVEVADESEWQLSTFGGKEPGWTQTQECSHFVYLTGGDGGCALGPDSDVYEMYSWGLQLYAKRDQLMDGGDGLICYGVVMNVTRA